MFCINVILGILIAIVGLLVILVDHQLIPKIIYIVMVSGILVALVLTKFFEYMKSKFLLFLQLFYIVIGICSLEFDFHHNLEEQSRNDGVSDLAKLKEAFYGGMIFVFMGMICSFCMQSFLMKLISALIIYIFVIIRFEMYKSETVITYCTLLIMMILVFYTLERTQKVMFITIYK